MDSFKIGLPIISLTLKIIDLDFVIIIASAFAFITFIIKIIVIAFKFIAMKINSLLYYLMKIYFKDQNSLKKKLFYYLIILI